MNVLVACEESQRVCISFRERGHIAYSCDLQESSGGHPNWHIKGDALKLINGRCRFVTEDGTPHEMPTTWDLIIAHPPCTRLCISGQRWLYFGTEEYKAKKRAEQAEAIDFFMAFVKADCPHIAIENPNGIMGRIYRKADCFYNPYDFKGETDIKTTCLWLKNLPPLVPNQRIPKEERTPAVLRANFEGKQYSWHDPETAKLRSKTPWGVARAMAEQWGGVDLTPCQTDLFSDVRGKE